MRSFTFDKEDISLETVPSVSHGCLSWGRNKRVGMLCGNEEKGDQVQNYQKVLISMESDKT